MNFDDFTNELTLRGPLSATCKDKPLLPKKSQTKRPLEDYSDIGYHSEEPLIKIPTAPKEYPNLLKDSDDEQEEIEMSKHNPK